MKVLSLIFAFVLLTASSTIGQTTIELDSEQSMILTGKGPGQDATINPYLFQEDYDALVENLGESTFSIRIQESNSTKVVRTIIIAPGEIRRITLTKEQQLYVDSTDKSKVKVDFKKKAKEN